MLKLKKVLAEINQTQVALADHCGLSKASIAQLINHEVWPKCVEQNVLRLRIVEFLVTHGAMVKDPFSKVEPECSNTQAPDHKSNQSQEDVDMLLRKQTLTPAAKRHFEIVRDPFSDLQCDDDMWVSPDLRYVREHMYSTAKHGGFLAVTGESGSGKSTVRRSLEQRIANENIPVILVQPYVLAAEDNDKKGKTLKSTHIAEAILATVAPMERLKSSPEARFQQLHRVLKDAHKSGQRVCVVIEEAHSLPIPTLKHLKRLFELEVGYTKLISIILIGQPELLIKLSERNPEVREIVQRCEVVTLPPIEVSKLEDFIHHRLARIGKSAKDVINQEGITAIASRLVSRNNESQLYPLAVGNFLVASMNLAAKIGVDKIDADVINEVA
jgi:type II secretory pathway predicted ATPase ExeA